MNLLIEKTVFWGLLTCWCRAGCPTSRSPLSVKATTEGVIRFPVELMSTFGWAPSVTATTEFVVPRSMPMIFDMVSTFLMESGELRGAAALAAALEEVGQGGCQKRPRWRPPQAASISKDVASGGLSLPTWHRSLALGTALRGLSFALGTALRADTRSVTRRRIRSAAADRTPS